MSAGLRGLLRAPGFFGDSRREVDESEVPVIRIATVIVGAFLIVVGIFWKQLGHLMPFASG